MVMLRGHLGADPEVRQTKNGTKVANLSVATQHRYKDGNDEWQEKTTWHKVILWAGKAELAEQYLHKGSPIFVQGRMQTNSWENEDGEKRYRQEIVGYRLDFLGSGDGQASGGGNKSSLDSSTDLGSADGMDDELPF